MADDDYDTWVVCRHRFPDGKSAVITVNTSLVKRVKFGDYPHHVAIAIDAAPRSLDASGRIAAHESQHLVALSRVIREALESQAPQLIAIVHGAGSRTLVLHARDGAAIARCLNALKKDKTWDRPWRFEIIDDPAGRESAPWRDIAAAAADHHLAINVPHSSPSADHHHYLF
jgi:hypothetical protein